VSAQRPRVVIADDHPIVAQGLRALLTESCDVVALVHDARQIEQALQTHQPDLLLLDISMPYRNGLELLAQLGSQFPKVRVVIVTMHVDQVFADTAMQNGAAAFVTKEAPAEELRTAITTVMSGERYRSPRIVRRRHDLEPGLYNPLLERLTPRQLEILRLTAEGKTATEAGKSLGVSPRTIEFHRLRIRKVLGIKTEWGLLRFAIMAKLSDIPGAVEDNSQGAS